MCFRVGVGMYEIASVAVGAVAFGEESAASFCLILRVGLLVLFELVESMGKFALFFIWTVTLLYELFAELRLFFVGDM